jgi:molybdenum cofactor synthesis domain-containing protein
MDVAVVTVGDELLAGDTENTNATWLCRRLDERGVSVERVATLPDRVADIARVVNEYLTAYDAVVVTGGLGPTHDDLTMEGVAAAVGRDVERHEAAFAWLTEEGGYAADALASGTAELPAGARFLPNEVGVAPGAVVEATDDGGAPAGRVYVLPGVPAEMKAMFDAVAGEFAGETTHTVTVYADEPESALVDRVAELRQRFDVRVGSYPGESVRLKLTGTDEATVEAAADWLRGRVEAADYR